MAYVATFSAGKFVPAPDIVRDTITKALECCPSLRMAAGVPWTRRDVRGETYGHATWRLDGSSVKFYIAVGSNGDDAMTIGVILHELAHAACWNLHEPAGDADYEFGIRCIDAHNEWNEHSGSAIKVDAVQTGPYRGYIGRQLLAIRKARRNA